MSNKFNDYITNLGFGTTFRPYEHADRLYIGGAFAKSPKFGFLYFVRFNINPKYIKDTEWGEKDRYNVGLLAKKIDLPKFNIATETLNQYNRKTIIQKSISYNPINIDLHDDNTNITHLLWVNYYKSYYVDGQQNNAAFENTKYGKIDYNYGRYDNGLNNNFFDSIEIYVMHQGNFTKYTLVNPKIKDWKHDSVDQGAGNKILENKLTVEFETVFYKQGKLVKGTSDYFVEDYYDKTPGPHTEGNDLLYKRRGISPFDKTLQTPRFKSIRPAPVPVGDQPPDPPPGAREYGIKNRPQASDMLTQLGTVVLKNYVNQNGLTRQNATEYNIAGSLLSYTLNSGSGKYGKAGPANEYAEPAANAPGVFTVGGFGINIFKGFNESVDGKIRANPASIIFPPKG